MSEFTPAHLESVVAACRENLAAIGENLSQCFDSNCRLELGKDAAWTAESEASDSAGPGLIATIGVGDQGQGLMVLIPANLPLPDWYTKPGDSENARLQTLAMEWSMNLLPADLEAGRSATVDVPNLWAALKEAAPTDSARMLELLVFAPASQSGESTAATPASSVADAVTPVEGTETANPADPVAIPRAKLLMVWPVAHPLFEKPASSEESAAPVASGGETITAGTVTEAGCAGDSSPMNEFRERARRLFHLPVEVSVRLAEKRIAMGQLLSITPGALITFNKSCDDLLDLYVNNRKYCRGEAVKIGEKFGLKINEVGIVDVRKEKIL